MAADVSQFRVVGPVFEVVGGPAARGVGWAWARQDLDMLSAPAARAELMGVLSGDEPGTMLVYLGGECFVDLHGLQMLLDVAAHQRYREGELVVVAPPRCLRVMLDLLGLHGSLALEATAWEAAFSARTRAARLDRCGSGGGSW